MKPNLIVIMADQLRYDALGMGFTPNIDKLASESVVFERAYSACPLCVPARGAFFTGKHPSNNGSLINPWEEKDAHYGNVKAGIENLYELVENDWESIHSGKQHLFTECGKLEDRVCGKTFFASTEKTYKSFLKENGKRMPGGERFRTYVPEMVSGSVTKVTKYSNAEYGCYDEDERFYFDEYFTDCAVRALRNRKGDKPLFLSAMYLAPHPPLEIPEPWYSIVGEDDFSLPDNVGRYYPYQSPLQMYNLPGIVGSHYTREHWKKAWRVYLGEVALLDDCVGKLISELKREGIYDDSIIIFTSDHGEMLGSHALFQKMCMYEEAVRVPLYIRYPESYGIRHKRIDSVVSHVDVLPTLSQCLGFSISSVDGKSLLSLSKNGEIRDSAAFIQFDGNGAFSNFQRAVVYGHFKLVVDFFKDEFFYELYDVENDRQEKNNLIFNPDYDDKATILATLLSAHMTEVHDHLGFPQFDLASFREKHKDLMVP